MKKYIGIICSIAGAVIWITVAGIYFSEGKTGFAIIQVIISVLVLINAGREYLKHKKK